MHDETFDNRMAMLPLVHIVILNFNGWNDSYECIASCFQLAYENFKVVLIDNGSAEDLSGRLLEDFPETVYLKNPRNTGFSSGCNLGIRYALSAKADFVWLLNNDTVVDKNSLSEMIACCPGFDCLGIVSPKIYYHGSGEVWSSGGYFNKMAMAVNYTDDVCANRRVDFVTGCAMLVPTAVFSQYGLLDDDYFLNIEDWEICRRLTDQGRKLYVVGTSVIQHKVSKSKKGGATSPLDTYYTVRNRLYFIAQYYGLPRRACLYAVFAVWWPAWLLANWLVGKRAIVKPFIHGVLDYFRGTKGCCEHYSG